MKKLHRLKKWKPEHVLVRIKNELDLSQAEIPEYFNLTLDTFKNIVHGRVKSWDKYAATVSRATGVAVKSLLENSPRKPLLGTDGKQWTAQKYRAGIVSQHLGNLVTERSRGRHTLQWFRIVMIKVCRCMLAAYQDKKSHIAFWELLQAVGKVGKSFPSYTAKVPYKPKPGELLRYEVLPGRGSVLFTEICPAQVWDGDLQTAVAGIPSRSRKGVIKIFGGFVKAVLTEERHQNKAGENDLITAEKKAREIHKASQVKPAKPPRR